MGWFREGLAGHEGYAVGLVPLERHRNGVAAGEGFYRELVYGDEQPRSGIRVAQAACDCGWRSARIHVAPAEWSPYSLFLGERDDERVRGLWAEHVEQVLFLAELARRGAEHDAAELLARARTLALADLGLAHGRRRG